MLCICKLSENPESVLATEVTSAFYFSVYTFSDASGLLNVLINVYVRARWFCCNSFNNKMHMSTHPDVRGKFWLFCSTNNIRTAVFWYRLSSHVLVSTTSSNQLPATSHIWSIHSQPKLTCTGFFLFVFVFVCFFLRSLRRVKKKHSKENTENKAARSKRWRQSPGVYSYIFPNIHPDRVWFSRISFLALWSFDRVPKSQAPGKDFNFLSQN